MSCGDQVEGAGCEVLARLLGALDPVLVLERWNVDYCESKVNNVQAHDPV